MATGTYQQSGPSAPQTARAVLFAPPGQTKGFGDVPARLETNGFIVQARAAGAGGEAITLAIVVAGTNTPLSVSVAGNAITVNSATNAAGAASSTARQVVDAINGSAPASALVTAAVSYGSAGTGTVSALAATPLAGDRSVTVGQNSSAPLPKQHPTHDSYA